jgi:ABC-2 type transport system permease protein
MSTATTQADLRDAGAPEGSRGGPVTISPTYVKIDLRRQLRNKRTLIFLVVMPVAFFLAFGGGYRTSDPAAYAYVMASMAVYGAMIATTSVGASTSMERSQGWTRQLRLTPLRPVGYVLGKVLVAVVLGIVPIALVLAVGAVGGAQLSAAEWAGGAVAAWGCSLVFAAFGLFMGYLIPAENVMQFIGPLLAFLSFFGGLFAPIDTLPTALQHIAPSMPTYAVGEIARSPITHTGFTVTHLALLVGWTVAFGIGTALLFRRDTTRG